MIFQPYATRSATLFSSALRSFIPASARAVCIGAALIIGGCQTNTVKSEDLPAIEIGSASPQTTPVPTGDAAAPDLPQIEIIDAPNTVSPGQVVSVRLGTNFAPPEGVTGVAVNVDGVDGWFKASSAPEPAAISDTVDWIFPVTVIVADTAPPGEQVRIDFALLATGDEAGGFKAWQPLIDITGAVACPQDSECSATECGPDPVCGLACGGCNNGDTCNGLGQCEPIGSACPDIADCTDRVCGSDPVCGTSCGTCQVGETCDLNGLCVPGDMVCGDGVKAGSETCDGADVGTETCLNQGFDGGTLACNGTCDGFDTTNCTYACGDNGIDPGESCDGTDLGTETCVTQGFDGGALACNGTCDGFDTTNCTYACGDNGIDPGESCDGTDVGTETCLTQGFGGGTLTCNGTCDGFDTSSCTFVCGDGSVDAGEGCDDSNATAGDGCDATCAVESGWQCAGDPSVCTAICGDGQVLGTETCDGANVGAETCQTQGFDTGALACNVTCDAFDVSGCSYVCGDGNIDPGEACDDSNTSTGDGCDASCAIEAGWQCSGDPSVCVETCGNGAVDANEDCDASDLNAATCASEGFDGGTLACSASCTFDTTACFVCGDGVLNGTEGCDGTDFGINDCIGVGFDAGTPTCPADCSTADYTACTFTCGDNGVDPGETCDGTDLGTETCLAQGFDAGTLACASDCLGYDTAACTYTCGNDVANGAEVCDGSDLLGEDCSTQGFAAGTLTCDGSCTAFVTDACITQGEVQPLWPLNGEGWGSWVTATGPGALDTLDEACDPSTADQCSDFVSGMPGRGDPACQHAGELRQLVLPYADCTDVTLNDELGAFDWICDDSLGVARAVSTGKKDGVYLSDLIDWNALPIKWKDNFVNYSDGVTPDSTTAGAWWLTPVQTATGGQLPTQAGVFVVASNLALPVTFSTSSQSLVTKPGVATILGSSNPGSPAHVVSGGGGSTSDWRAFLWVEADIDAFGDIDGIDFGTYAPFATVENTTIVRVSNSGGTGITLGTSSHSATIRAVSLDDVREGFNIAGRCGLMEDVLIVGEGVNGYSTSHGIYLNAGDWTMRRVTSVANASDGIYAYNADDSLLDDAILADNGASGLETRSFTVGLVATNIRVYNNGGYGIYNGGWDNHIQHFISGNNGYYGARYMTGASLGIFASNGQHGSGENTFEAGVTVANNGFSGIYRTEINLNTLAISNLGNGIEVDGSGYLSDIASLYNDQDASTNAADIDETGFNVFSGRMLVTDSTNTNDGTTWSTGSCEASSSTPVSSGQGIDDTCTANPNTASNSVVTSAPGLPDVVSYAAADTANSSDNNATDMQGPGRAVVENVTDWHNFDNNYRTWGEYTDLLLSDPANTSAGRCSAAAENCAIWDWRISVADTVVRNALAAELPLDGSADARFEVLDAPYTSATNCGYIPGAVWDSPIAGQCSITFLRRAVEILGDGAGNENSFCESGEDCIRLRHIGGYQGTGNLVQVQTIGTGGTIENVNLFEYDSW